jgi:hypothetical protein
LSRASFRSSSEPILKYPTDKSPASAGLFLLQLRCCRVLLHDPIGGR